MAVKSGDVILGLQASDTSSVNNVTCCMETVSPK